MRLLLASASPRRRELLAAAGLAFDVAPVNADESRHAGEAPQVFAERVARLKVDLARAQHPGRVVLAADTVVVAGEEVLGKPVDAADAARMLRRLSGGPHEVLTGVAVADGRRIVSAVESTTVWMTALTDEEIAWYVASGEPMDKAGGYAIQGLASRFIPRIDGSYGAVVGLPVETVVRLLRTLGVDAAGIPATDGA